MSDSAPWALANYREMTGEPRAVSPHEREWQAREEQRRNTNLRIRRKLQKVT